jgi:hypothetical protein
MLPQEPSLSLPADVLTLMGRTIPLVNLLDVDYSDVRHWWR